MMSSIYSFTSSWN